MTKNAINSLHHQSITGNVSLR